MKVKKTVYDVATGEYKIVWEEDAPPIDEPVLEPMPTIEEQIVALQAALINQKIRGRGGINLKDSSENKILDLKIFGNSEQLTTTGAQLFDLESCVINNNNVTSSKDILSNSIIASGKRYCYIKVPTETGQRYYFQADITNGYISLYEGKEPNNQQDLYGKSYGSINSEIKKHTFISVSDCLNFYLYPNGENTIFKNIMLSKTDSPYESYTGGFPTPNLEYPQKIYNVGKYNEKTEKYEVNIKVLGNNFFCISRLPSQFENVTIINGEIHLPIGGAMYFNTLREIIPEARVGDVFYIFADSTSDRKFVSFYPSGQQTTYGKSFVVKSLDDMLLLYSDSTKNNIIKNIMVSKENSNNYEPYREPKTITITSDRQITKWDKLEKRDNVYGWVYGGEIIDSYNSEEINTEYISTTGSLTEGATVIYKLNEPKFVPLSREEQIPLKNLSLYYPTTNILVDSGEVEADLEVEYIADTKNFILNKIDEVKNQITNMAVAILEK